MGQRGTTYLQQMSVTPSPRKDMILAMLAFAASTLITWWFIAANDTLYHGDRRRMMLSCAIAGAKWAAQILAALLLLKEKRWAFLRRIGLACLAGSAMLGILAIVPVEVAAQGLFFIIGLLMCVGAMIVLYWLAVRKTGLSMVWFGGWLVCLAIAITLQLTVVFHVAR